MSIKNDLSKVLKKERKIGNKSYVERIDTLLVDLSTVNFEDVKKVVAFIDKALDQCRDTNPREELQMIREKVKDSL